MQTNLAPRYIRPTTAGGSAAAEHLTPLQQLRRTLLSCLLWEDEFYEDGQSIADRLVALASKVSPQEVAALADEARNEHNLRHAPLLLLLALVAAPRGLRLDGVFDKTIRRADEITELLSLYWRHGKRPLSKQLKRGIARAFGRFDAYQLAKYDRAKAVRLRDAMLLCHPKPKDDAQAALWKQLLEGTLPSPDTWEVALSAGGDKRDEFTRLLTERKLGYLALLRNLRNMVEAGVDLDLIRPAILARQGAEKVLPFRYVAAARACPALEPTLDLALQAAILAMPAPQGRTVVLVDVSPSMDVKLSAKSDLSRMDAAATLAAVFPGEVRMFSFSSGLVEVPPRKGMAGVDAILRSQPHNGTELFAAVRRVNEAVAYDRIVVITDEQETSGRGTMPAPRAGAKGYLINVASNRNGVGYGPWTHLDGFSESVIRWIIASEAERVG